MLIMKKGFTLVELTIVAAVLGIMAAIVVPMFQSHSSQAKKSVAMDNLRVLRSAIELYTARHGGIPPGYENNNPLNTPSSTIFFDQLMVAGDFMRQMPENPFNELSNIWMVSNNASFPANPVDDYGWVYQPATKTIRLNWPGTDDDSVRYFDY
ncbi:type II secretion system protein [Planctomycetota bacterium]